MTDIPKICAFESHDAPESDRWLAFFYVARPSGKGVERLPITFNGRTEDEARNVAARFWYDERAKEAARKEAALLRAANKKAAA